MTGSREGGCACGAVRYRLTSDPLFVHCCHCLNCQRQTGSAFVINVLIEADRVELPRGRAAAGPRTTGGSGKQTIFRCPTCQVALFSRYTRATVRFVRAGTLDDPASVEPDVHILHEIEAALGHASRVRSGLPDLLRPARSSGRPRASSGSRRSGGGRNDSAGGHGAHWAKHDCPWAGLRTRCGSTWTSSGSASSPDDLCADASGVRGRRSRLAAARADRDRARGVTAPATGVGGGAPPAARDAYGAGARPGARNGDDDSGRRTPKRRSQRPGPLWRILRA